MRGNCPVCGFLIVARLQALGGHRAGEPHEGDLTVCQCRELLVVANVSPVMTPHPVGGMDFAVIFRKATAMERAGLDPKERRVMDEAKLINESFPGDRRVYRGH